MAEEERIAVVVRRSTVRACGQNITRHPEISNLREAFPPVCMNFHPIYCYVPVLAVRNLGTYRPRQAREGRGGDRRISVNLLFFSRAKEGRKWDITTSPYCMFVICRLSYTVIPRDSNTATPNIIVTVPGTRRFTLKIKVARISAKVRRPSFHFWKNRENILALAPARSVVEVRALRFFTLLSV